MDFDYIIADPTGNITVLVTSPYTAENRQEIIRQSFDRVPSCEQVGFIMPVSGTSVRLEMMAYEFCGNATLSAAAWHAGMHGLKKGCETDITVLSSGVNSPLNVHVRNHGSLSPARKMPAGSTSHLFSGDTFVGTISMPAPQTDSYRGYPLIRFDGISHLIVPSGDFSDAQAEKAVKEFAGELGVPALGMMLTEDPDAVTSEDPASKQVRIRPLVYVPGSETLFWEQGCATGSTAIGWYRYDAAGITATEAVQPGGTIRLDIENGQPRLTGNVTFLR